mmetsp:Transcript_23988/g.66384  ORF Transcript_23988/g.66384 Transcript_23988/m.66384 type:complete len:210 (-) Transcript_23988:411-1040(-)
MHPRPATRNRPTARRRRVSILLTFTLPASQPVPALCRPLCSLDDEYMQAWWTALQQFMPAVQQTLADDPAWLGGGGASLDRESLIRLTSTVFTWVSWVHEDVGHAASYFVYNPTLTPMAVSAHEEEPGIPLNPFALVVNAYRTFVFLDRAKLLDPPPDWWFDGVAEDKQCFLNFQVALRDLGDNDAAFSECGTTGFYSCVEDVETAVSS